MLQIILFPNLKIVVWSHDEVLASQAADSSSLSSAVISTWSLPDLYSPPKSLPSADFCMSGLDKNFVFEKVNCLPELSRVALLDLA